MEALSKLFGGAARVKVLKLFLFNTEAILDLGVIAERTKLTKAAARKEIHVLEGAGLITKGTAIIEKEKNGVRKKVRVAGYAVNQTFEFLLPLQQLLIHTTPLRQDQILKRLARVGKLKLVIVAGVFIQNPDSRLDILIVGDNLKPGAVDSALRFLESEIGKELKYATFDTADFKYRLNVYDKLVRDVLDYSHQTIVDKLGLTP